jgi:hypothetical integral membrane protein (TIGR02206 family)
LQQFSQAHLAALAVLLIGVGASVWALRRHPGRWSTPAALALAAIIFAAWAGEYVADVVLGTWSVQYTLPLQLTDAVSVVSILALITRKALLIELMYFWAMTATLQAVLTPDLAHTFPSIYYFTYFGYHDGAIIAAVALVFGCRRYPRPGAVRRTYAATFVVALCAGLGDLLTGGNYMYLSEKPEHSSLLNVMGPWPWYIASTALLGLALMILVKVLTDWAKRHDPAAAPTKILEVH